MQPIIGWMELAIALAIEALKKVLEESKKR